MNERELNIEINHRARACRLAVDCLPYGKLDSEIVIIGEAPTEHEAKMRMPLVGGTGNLVWDILKSIDIYRTQCYVTNVIKQQVNISGKKDAIKPVSAVETEHWEGILDWELDQLPNVKYILCLGDYALHALTGDKGIRNWRGSVTDIKVGKLQRTVQVIITNNPSHILRAIDQEPFYKFDIAKLRRVIDGKFKRHSITGTINPNYAEAIAYIERLECSDQPIAFDIEVIANETACIGFANNAHEGISINFRDSRTNVYTIEEEKMLRIRIQKFFSNKSNKFIAQNGSFDSGWLWYKDRIHVNKIWFDTLLAHHTLYPRLPHNLGFLTAQYTDHPYYKDEGKTWREGGNINQFWDYNVKDCCITWAAHDKLHKELVSQKMDTFFFDHVMRLQPHLINMQVNGILVDKTLKTQIAEDLERDLTKQLDKLYKLIQDEVGDPTYAPNLNSPVQMRTLLFDKLKLVGRGASTNKENRDRMRVHSRTTEKHIEILNGINHYAVEKKFYSTYAMSRSDEDGRFRCEYKQFGTQKAPGRLSSSGTLWGSGGNLQNQPQRAYPMFIADPDYMFSYFDLKQAEAKVVAYLWQVQGLIESFKRAETDINFDLHRGNAAAIFKCEYEEVPAYDRNENGDITLRFLGKRCVHGLNYRMQPQRLADTCNIPYSQANEAYSSYHKAFPEIKRAWNHIVQGVREDKKLYSPLGRRMIYLSRITDDELDSVIAFGPQSTIGDKVSSVIYECHEHPDWPKNHARMVLNIHDALIALHVQDPHVTETVQGIMKQNAESPIMIRGEAVSIGTDFKQSIADEGGIHRWSTLQTI
jgi:uracil-DNA glycosylase family 4